MAAIKVSSLKRGRRSEPGTYRVGSVGNVKGGWLLIDVHTHIVGHFYNNREHNSKWKSTYNKVNIPVPLRWVTSRKKTPETGPLLATCQRVSFSSCHFASHASANYKKNWSRMEHNSMVELFVSHCPPLAINNRTLPVIIMSNRLIVSAAFGITPFRRAAVRINQPNVWFQVTNKAINTICAWAQVRRALSNFSMRDRVLLSWAITKQLYTAGWVSIRDKGNLSR